IQLGGQRRAHLVAGGQDRCEVPRAVSRALRASARLQALSGAASAHPRAVVAHAWAANVRPGMADWATISSLATAGGTLVLALATFSSVRSANRSARLAERSLLAAQRPVLIPSREDDPAKWVTFADHALTVQGNDAVIEVFEGRVYMALALRNGGSGLAVIHGWCVF